MRRLMQQWKLGAVRWQWYMGRRIVSLYIWRWPLKVWRRPSWGKTHREDTTKIGAGPLELYIARDYSK